MSELMYTRGSGEKVRIPDMNDFHLGNAIKKLRNQGYSTAADRTLLESDPESAALAGELFVSDILTALEDERADRLRKWHEENP